MYPMGRYFFIPWADIFPARGQIFFHPVGRYFFIPWADIFSSRGQIFFQPMGRYFFIPWADIFSSRGQIFFHPMGRYFFIPWADIFSSRGQIFFQPVEIMGKIIGHHKDRKTFGQHRISIETITRVLIVPKNLEKWTDWNCSKLLI